MHLQPAVFLSAFLFAFPLHAESSEAGLPGAISGSAGPDSGEEIYQPPEVIGDREAVCPAPASETQSNRSCTQMACTDGLTIRIDPNYKWQSGDYVFTFKSGDKVSTCKGSLPLKSCDSMSIACSATWAQITESGCALPKDAQGFGDITVNGYVNELSVTITHDGEPIARRSLAPRYNSSRPNGPGCDPVCCQAREELPIH